MEEEKKPLVDPERFSEAIEPKFEQQEYLTNEEREMFASFLRSTLGIRVMKALKTRALNLKLAAGSTPILDVEKQTTIAASQGLAFGIEAAISAMVELVNTDPYEDERNSQGEDE